MLLRETPAVGLDVVVQLCALQISAAPEESSEVVDVRLPPVYVDSRRHAPGVDQVEAGGVVHWEQRLVEVMDLALQVVGLVRQLGWKDVDGSNLQT
jgi:hypothetical protein